ADLATSLIIGLILYFAPDKVVDLIFGRTTDGVHWHLVRCIGGQILASAYLMYRFLDRPKETRTACYLIRFMAGAFALLLCFHTRSLHKELIDANLLQWIVYLCFASTALYMILLLVNKFQVGETLFKCNPISNILYQLDTLAAILIGMAWMTCPHWLLHRQVKVQMDASHELCGRIMGSLFVSSYIISAHALHWKDQLDRAIALEARVVCCLFILSAQIWSQIAYGKDWTGSHWVGISLFSIWTVIAVIYRGYLLIFGEGPKGKDVKKSS
uniref:Uncharacterized protein n=1 Tax=Acrobeloides nanus TaxID=290746 RepID=A0A914EF21_9BILA